MFLFRTLLDCNNTILTHQEDDDEDSVDVNVVVWKSFHISESGQRRLKLRPQL